MKKIYSLFLCLSLILMVIGCGSSKDDAAKDLGSTAFQNIHVSYDYTSKICEDMITAYNFGQDMNNGGNLDTPNFVSNLNLSEDQVLAGVTAILNDSDLKDETITAMTEKGAADSVGRIILLVLMGQLKDENGDLDPNAPFDLRGAMVEIVDKSYEISGGYESAQENLNLAKGALSTLSQEYSDTQYYTEVKEFYDYENDFLGFCDKIDRVYASSDEIINTLQNYRDDGQRMIDSLEITFAGTSDN